MLNIFSALPNLLMTWGKLNYTSPRGKMELNTRPAVFHCHPCVSHQIQLSHKNTKLYSCKEQQRISFISLIWTMLSHCHASLFHYMWHTIGASFYAALPLGWSGQLTWCYLPNHIIAATLWSKLGYERVTERDASPPLGELSLPAPLSCWEKKNHNDQQTSSVMSLMEETQKWQSSLGIARHPGSDIIPLLPSSPSPCPFSLLLVARTCMATLVTGPRPESFMVEQLLE